MTFNTIGDNVLNAQEINQDQILSGIVANAHPGDILTLTLNGHTYQTIINADMTWAVTLPGADLAALADGSQSFTASVTSYCGNSAQAQGSFTVDTQAPGILIDILTDDNIINSDEHGWPQPISGSAIGATAGDNITVTVDGHTFYTRVATDGSWEVGVPAEVMQSLAGGNHTIVVQVTDAAGNVNTATHDFSVNLTAPTLTMNAVAVDDTIDSIEKEQPLTLSGTCSADTMQVTVIISGKSYNAIVNGGEWSVTLDPAQVNALPSGDLNVFVSASSAIGNSTLITHPVHVDDQRVPAISIDPLTADNILNAFEVATNQTLSGKTLNTSAGDTVTITLNGKTYTTTVDADLRWKITLPSTDLKALAEGSVTITAQVTAGNGNDGRATRVVTVDVTAPVVTIDQVTADNIINHSEHSAAQVISGTATNAVAGTSVTVSLNGKSYLAVTDAAGKWSVGVPAADIALLNEGSATVNVTVTDAAGNAGTASRTVTVDLTGPTIAVNAVTADNVINASEKSADITLTGTCGTDAASVKITINGKTYDATVTGGTWSVSIAPADSALLAEGKVTVIAIATDAAGNSTTVTRDVTVDTVAPV
ncbi:Ig-like domain-containing protein, partial [Atlantibacter subterraneus]|uniref:Ig-like domain-containing protein n=1 Tax=Atlantibacter subterraneus TaxID=255519 RepID=UPI0028AEB24F